MSNKYGRKIAINNYFSKLEISLPCGYYWSPDVINQVWRSMLNTKLHYHNQLERLLTPCNGRCK